MIYINESFKDNLKKTIADAFDSKEETIKKDGRSRHNNISNNTNIKKQGSDIDNKSFTKKEKLSNNAFINRDYDKTNTSNYSSKSKFIYDEPKKEEKKTEEKTTETLKRYTKISSETVNELDNKKINTLKDYTSQYGKDAIDCYLDAINSGKSQKSAYREVIKKFHTDNIREACEIVLEALKYLV